MAAISRIKKAREESSGSAGQYMLLCSGHALRFFACAPAMLHPCYMLQITYFHCFDHLLFYTFCYDNMLSFFDVFIEIVASLFFGNLPAMP